MLDFALGVVEVLLWLLAQTLEDYQKQLEQINYLISENQKKLDELTKEEKNLLLEISIINSKIQLYEEKLEILNNQINKLNEEIELLNKKKKILNEEINQTKQKLNKTAKLLYKIPKRNIWELILETGSFYESYRIQVSLMSILRYYKLTVDNLREKERNLEYVKLEIDKNLKLLEKSREEQKIALNELNDLKNKKQNYLNKVRLNKSEKLAYLNELEKSKQKLEKLINELSKKRNEKKSNAISLIIPVNGKIVNDFGYVYDNVYGTRIKNNGIDIKAPKNSPVRAAESGEVVYVGFIEGYGNIIIIEHSGFWTIYSQIIGINVKKGDKVIKGQQIAKVGDELFHFELRIGKEAVDPKPYFTSQF